MMQTCNNQFINVNGKTMNLSHPQVMGILNITPDSFYSESRKQTEAEIITRIHQIHEEGASIIDIGACSTRPNAELVSAKEEVKRLRMGLQLINKHWPNAVISVDTFRADTAKMCVEEYNAAIINDISSGDMDKQMFTTVSHLGVPYIMMHMKGTPQNMQNRPHYDNLLKEIFFHFSERIQELYDLGAKNLILDPGFGFGKTMEHNYELMNHLNEFHIFGLPILVGTSRKSMIYNLLECSPQESLNGTTVLNTLALTKGANILRVHDVKAATETIKIVNKMKTCSSF